MPAIKVKALCSICDWEFKSSFAIKNGSTRNDVQRIANAARKYCEIHANNHQRKTGHEKFLHELDTQGVQDSFFELTLDCVCDVCGWHVERSSKTIQDIVIEPEVMGDLIYALKEHCVPHIKAHIKETDHESKFIRCHISTNMMRDIINE